MKVRRHYHSNVDIVLLLDATGSMGWCRDEIVDHICGFADDLSRLQHDIQIALYVFLDLKFLETPHPYPFTEMSFACPGISRAARAAGDRLSAPTRAMPRTAPDL